MFGSRVAFAASILRTFELLIQPFAAPAAFSRWAAISSRGVTFRIFTQGALNASFLETLLLRGSTSSPASVLGVHLGF